MNFVRSSKELCVCWVHTFKPSTDKTSWGRGSKAARETWFMAGHQRLAMTFFFCADEALGHDFFLAFRSSVESCMNLVRAPVSTAHSNTVELPRSVETCIPVGLDTIFRTRISKPNYPNSIYPITILGRKLRNSNLIRIIRILTSGTPNFIENLIDHGLTHPLDPNNPITKLLVWFVDCLFVWFVQ